MSRVHRAAVQQEVASVLDAELPRAYTPDIFTTKAALVFQHLIDHPALASC